MNEPDNHTAVIDRFGDTWVRADEIPSRDGTWFPLTDGPGWDARSRNGVGWARTWVEVEVYGPFTEASAERAEQALERVRKAVA